MATRRSWTMPIDRLNRYKRPPAKKRNQVPTPGHGGNFAARLAWEKRYIDERAPERPEQPQMDDFRNWTRPWTVYDKQMFGYRREMTRLSLEAMAASQAALERGEI